MKINTTINDALYELGVVDVTEEPTPEDSAFALRTLNRIMDSYNTQNLTIPFLHTIQYDRKAWDSCNIEIKKSLPINFVRESRATYIDGGFLKYAEPNEKRYQDGVLLMEERKENIVANSELRADLTGKITGWEDENMILVQASSEQTKSVDGINELNKIVPAEGIPFVHKRKILHRDINIEGNFTISLKVNKPYSVGNLYVRFGEGLETESIVFFDIDNSIPWVNNDTTYMTSTVEEIGEYTLLLKIKVENYPANERSLSIGIASNIFQEEYESYSSNDQLYIENIQVETGDISSYIQTDGVIETRQKDEFVQEEANIISPFDQYDEGETKTTVTNLIDAQPPSNIQQVFFREDDTDYICSPMTQREFAQIQSKADVGIPTRYYVQHNSPTSTVISFNTIPMQGLNLVILGKQPYKTDFVATDNIQWGAGVEKMIMTRLALELANSYHIEPTSLLVAKASDAEGAVKTFNYQPRTINSDIGLSKRRGRNNRARN